MDKKQRYSTVKRQIAAVLEGEKNMIARMATINCLLSSEFEYFYWTGFYLVDPDNNKELIIGPYQGSLGCLRIAFGRGVCGVAAETGKTQLVDDVHTFPGHIACDSKSRSEIVVPIFNHKDNLLAVFDVDSTSISAFDEVDQTNLESIISDVFY